MTTRISDGTPISCPTSERLNWPDCFSKGRKKFGLSKQSIISKFAINKIIPENNDTNNGILNPLLKTNQSKDIIIPDSLFKVAHSTVPKKSNTIFL